MLLLFFDVNSYGKIKINVIVNNEIITNIDIIKEEEYAEVHPALSRHEIVNVFLEEELTVKSREIEAKLSDLIVKK